MLLDLPAVAERAADSLQRSVSYGFRKLNITFGGAEDSF
jgi:hypothetical protein